MLRYRATPVADSVSSGSSIVFNKQSGTAIGDWVLIGCFWAYGSTPSCTGFDATTSGGFTLLTRYIDGTEGSTFTVNLGSGSYTGAVMATVAGGAGIDPVTQPTPNTGTSSTSIAINSITLGNDGDWVLWFGGTDGSSVAPGITPPSGFTARATVGEQSNNPNALVAESTSFFDSGSIGTQTGTAASSADNWGGVMVGIAAAKEIANDFSGGTDGVGITTGNSGGQSGCAFDSIFSTPYYDNGYSMAGSSLVGLFSQSGSGGGPEVIWDSSFTATSVPQVWFRLYVALSAIPTSGGLVIFAVSGPSGSASRLFVNDDGTIMLSNTSGQSAAATTATLSADTVYKVEGTVIGDSSNGYVELKLFTDPDSDTPYETVDASGVNTAGWIDTAEFGAVYYYGTGDIDTYLGGLDVSTAGYPTSGTMMTVEVSATNLTWNLETKILVLTGVMESAGASAATNPSISNPQSSITPNYDDSFIVWEAIGSNTTYDISAATDNTLIDHDNADDPHYADGFYSGSVSADVAVTAGGVSDGIPGNEYCTFAAYELPPDGTAALSPNAPPVALSASSPVTTEGFLAPDGAVLVALVRLLPSATSTINISDSLGLSWTLRASTPSPTSNGQLAIYTATVSVPWLADADFVTGTSTTSITSNTISVQDGDVVVVKAVTNDYAISLNTPTGGGLTYGLQGTVNTSSHCYGRLWTAEPVSADSFAINLTGPSSGTYVMEVEVWRNASLAASPAVTATAISGQSTTLVTAQDNSVVSWIDGDWNAVDGSSRTYLSDATEEGYYNKASPQSITTYAAYQHAPTAGSQTIGLSAPTGQAATFLAIEIQPTSTGGADATATPSTVTGTASIPTPAVFPGTVEWQGAFDLALTPDESISSVTVTVQHHESSLTEVDSVFGQIYVSGVAKGSPAEFTKSLTDRTDDVVVTSGISVSDIPDLQVRVTAEMLTPGATLYIDYAKATITLTGSVQDADVDLDTDNIWVESVASVAAPQISTGASFAATSVSSAADIPSLGVSAGSILSPMVVSGSVSIPVPSPSSGADVSVSSADCSVAISQPGISTGASSVPVSVDSAAAIAVPFISRDITWQGEDFGLWASPESAVQSVTITVRHHESATSDFDSLFGQMLISGTPVGSPASFTLSATDRTDDVVVTSGIDPEDLPNLQVQVTGLAVNSSATLYIDWAYADVALAAGTQNAYPVPGAVSAVVSVPVPGILASSFVTASSADAVADVPVPGISIGASITATSVSGVASAGSVTVSTGSTAGPSSVDLVAEVPSPSVFTGVSAAPSAVDGTAEIPIPEIVASAVISVSAVEGIVSIAATAGAGSAYSATAVDGVAEIAEPSLTVGSIHSATSIDAIPGIPVPGIEAGGSANPHPTAVDAAVSIPSVAIQAESFLSLTCAESIVSVPAPGIEVSAGISGTSADAVASITEPGIAAGASPEPSSADSVAGIAQPQVEAGSLITASPVTGAVSVDTPFVAQDAIWQGEDFGLSAPPEQQIESVTITVRHHESAITDFESLFGQIYLTGTPVGSPTSFTLSATDRTDNVVVTSGITPGDLPNVQIRVTGHAILPSAELYIDWAYAEVVLSGAQQNASPTPGTVTGIASIPVPNVSASSVFSLVSVDCTAGIPVSGISSDVAVTATAVDGTIDVSTPGIGIGTTVTATAVDGIVGITSPSVFTAGNVDIHPVSVTAVVAITSPAVQTAGNVQINATTVDGAVSVPLPGITAGVTLSLSTEVCIVGIPVPSLSTGIGIAPVAVDGTASIPVPGIICGAQPLPVVVDSTAFIGLPSIQAGPAAVVCSANIPVPQIEFGTTVQPGTIDGVAGFWSPSILAGGSANVHVTTIEAASQIPSPGIVAGVELGAVTVTGTVTIPVPEFSSNVGITAAVVDVNTAIPGPSGIITSALVLPGVVTGIAAIPSPSLTAGSGPQPGGLTCVAEIPVPAVHTGATATAGLIGTISVPIPAISTSGTAFPVAVDAVTDVPVPDLGGGAGVQPACVTSLVSISAPSLSTGMLAAPGTVIVGAGIPTPVVSVWVAVPASAVTGSASIPVPVIEHGNVLSLSVVTGLSYIRRPSILSGSSTEIVAYPVECSASVPTPVVGCHAFPVNSTVTGAVSIPSIWLTATSILDVTTIDGIVVLPPPQMFVTVARSTPAVSTEFSSLPSVTDLLPESVPAVTETDTGTPAVGESATSTPSVTDEEPTSAPSVS